MATMTASTRRQVAQGTPYHDQRLARRLAEDAEFKAEFERQRREIAVIDGIVNKLDDLRGQLGLTKAELARAIGKNPASIRRLLTASGNPELRTVVAMANALGAEVKIVPKKRRTGRRTRRRRSGSGQRSSARADA